MKDLIHVMPPKRRLGSDRQRPALVSWGSIGTVSPERAIEFAQALLEAAQEAKGMNDLLR